jgi:hypothetical protein
MLEGFVLKDYKIKKVLTDNRLKTQIIVLMDMNFHLIGHIDAIVYIFITRGNITSNVEQSEWIMKKIYISSQSGKVNEKIEEKNTPLSVETKREIQQFYFEQMKREGM